MAKLNIGLIGVGRLGRVYARDLSTRIACTRITAIADTDKDLTRLATDGGWCNREQPRLSHKTLGGNRHGETSCQP